MTHGPQIGGDRNGMLRRVAIVLSSLPSSVASELLGSMSPNTRQSVRQAMSGLSDIDPLERQRAFHAFKTSMEQQPPPHREPVNRPGSSVVRGNTVRDSSAVEVTTTSHPASGQLHFLEDVDDEDLLDLLVGEHPQTIAVVLASVSPEKAGAILPRLDARTQTETLRRIGRLDTFPDEAIVDVAELFQQRVSKTMNRKTGSAGRSALNAILSAMPGHSHPNVHPPAVEHSNASVRPTAGPNTAQTERGQTESDTFRARPAQHDFPTTDEPQRDLLQSLRVAEHTLPDAQTGTTSRWSATTAEPMPAASESFGNRNATSSPNLHSTDAIAKHLENLSPAALCQALGRVNTRVAVLALCGLPNAVSESALAMLPKSEAKKVRSAMSSLHSLNLRDIDDAKEAIARVSIVATSDTGSSDTGSSVAGSSVVGNATRSNQRAPVAA